MRSRRTSIRKRRRTRPTGERARKTWEKLTLGMNGIHLLKAQVKKMRKLQPLLSMSHRLHQDFTNMSDDDYYSPHIYLMAKGEKVKSKSKAKAPPPSPPSDISSSNISDSSSDEEIDKLTKNLDGKTKLFMTKLMEDLENVQAVL